MFVDATYVKAHEGARVVSKAIIVATGVGADGNREVLGLAVALLSQQDDDRIQPTDQAPLPHPTGGGKGPIGAPGGASTAGMLRL